MTNQKLPERPLLPPITDEDRTPLWMLAREYRRREARLDWKARGTVGEPVVVDEWIDGWDICRERNRPIVVENIAADPGEPDLMRLFPSGHYEILP